MWLDGSCHCRAVRFRLKSETPSPFMRCYCSICRKTAGGGGYAINIMGLSQTLTVEGAEALIEYRAARQSDGKPSELCRHFCGLCGSALWASDPRWPEGVWPFASAIDTPLPAPPEQVHIMESNRPAWADSGDRPPVRHFGEYPEESIASWHERHGITDRES